MIEIRVSDGSDDRPVTPDGPHSGARTRAVAQGIDAAVRILNYATSPDKHGLTYPSDVYSVLGELSAAMDKLPQALHQMTQYVNEQVADGRARENPGYGKHDGDTEAAYAELRAAVQRACNFSTETARLLGKAQSAISGLEVVERG